MRFPKSQVENGLLRMDYKKSFERKPQPARVKSIARKTTRVIVNMPLSKRRKILGYLPIDHCGEGFRKTIPQEGEKFFLYPYGYFGDNSIPFIGIMRGGKIIKMVNVHDLSEVYFEEN